MKNLQNSKIIITGASSGIGEATALALAPHNVNLLLVARNAENLDAVVQKIKAISPDCPTPVVVACDVTKDEDVHMMVETCRIIFGCADVLINNAGYGVYGASELTSLDDFRDVMEINFYGPLRCTYGLLPLMKKCNQGHIINVASVAACYGIPYLGAYGASKAALASINQSLRAELFNTDIEISIVYPGYTDTSFFENEKRIGAAIRPEKPYMSPREVAESILNIIIKGHGDEVLSMDGKALFILKDIFPGLVQNMMKRIARKLKS